MNKLAKATIMEASAILSVLTVSATEINSEKLSNLQSAIVAVMVADTEKDSFSTQADKETAGSYIREMGELDGDQLRDVYKAIVDVAEKVRNDARTAGDRNREARCTYLIVALERPKVNNSLLMKNIVKAFQQLAVAQSQNVEAPQSKDIIQ